MSTSDVYDVLGSDTSQHVALSRHDRPDASYDSPRSVGTNHVYAIGVYMCIHTHICKRYSGVMAAVVNGRHLLLSWSCSARLPQIFSGTVSFFFGLWKG